MIERSGPFQHLTPWLYSIFVCTGRFFHDDHFLQEDRPVFLFYFSFRVNNKKRVVPKEG